MSGRVRGKYLHNQMMIACVTFVLVAGFGVMVGMNDAGAAPPRSSQSASAQDFGIPQVATINKLIRQGWADFGYTPSDKATDGEWCRRVHLDLIGRIPSVAELEAFTKDSSPDKKAKLVSKLLGDEYARDYARHWTTIWTNILIGRSGGTERDTLISRDGMEQYLRRTFQKNKPYDRMVLELVTASGATMPGAEDFNGATNFLVGKYEEMAAQATSESSKIFLGMQVQCTQCHNHPFNDWKQNQFWEMNAFFRQSRPLRSFEGRNIAGVVLADETFPGEGGNPAEAEIYYELRNGLVKVAYPVFVDGTSLVDLHGEEKGNSGYLEDVNRREELGKLILKSEMMPKALVNRYWAHFLGYGFTKPIDDMGPHNMPTHPELLDYLGGQFREYSFDLQQLVRWIVLSEPYALSSRMKAGNMKDDPNLGEKPMFSHFYLRQMRAEELFDSLLTATQAQNSVGSEGQEKAKRDWMGQFVTAFGTDEGGESTTFNGTIPQVLMMMNGQLIQNALNTSKGSFLAQVAGAEMSNSERVEFLYKSALARKPTSHEVKVANWLLYNRGGDVPAALQDIWWVVLNSNEFILQH